MFVNTTPWILPVIVDLATESMPTDTPNRFITLGFKQVVVPNHNVVEVLNLEGNMLQTFGTVNTVLKCDRVVVGVFKALIQTCELHSIST